MCRIKDSEGNTVEYIIVDKKNNKTVKISADKLKKLSHYVSNARLLNNGEFRANPECKIDTVVNSDLSICIANNALVNKNINVNTFKGECYGINFINICRKIRELAASNKIVMDKAFAKHSSNSGNNIHLIKLIRACGIQEQDFIRSYLSHIQPYSLEYFQKRKDKSGDDVWLSDVGYRVKLVIKLRKKNNTEMILVSFHESNIIRHASNVKKMTQIPGSGLDPNKMCAVIVDTVNDIRDSGGMRYAIKFTVQRGFIVRIMSCFSDYYAKGVAFVKYDIIRANYQSMIDNLLDKLRDTYCDNVSNSIIGLNIDKVSIISFGYSVVNNISLLIDCFSFYTGKSDRRMLIEIANNILAEVPIEKAKELGNALKDKYESTAEYNNQLYKEVICLCQ